MSSLIITVLSIALAAAIGLSALYFGGSAYSDSLLEAEAAKRYNEGEQIVKSFELFRASRLFPPLDVNELVQEGYLSNLPAQEDWEFSGSAVVASAEDDKMCGTYNKRLHGSYEIPNCADVNTGGLRFEICCKR